MEALKRYAVLSEGTAWVQSSGCVCARSHTEHLYIVNAKYESGLVIIKISGSQKRFKCYWQKLQNHNLKHSQEKTTMKIKGQNRETPSSGGTQKG